MSSSQNVEIAIRAGMVAKSVLNIAGTQSAVCARLQLMDAVQQIQLLDKKLAEFIAVEAKTQPGGSR